MLRPRPGAWPSRGFDQGLGQGLEGLGQGTLSRALKRACKRSSCGFKSCWYMVVFVVVLVEDVCVIWVSVFMSWNIFVSHRPPGPGPLVFPVVVLEKTKRQKKCLSLSPELGARKHNNRNGRKSGKRASNVAQVQALLKGFKRPPGPAPGPWNGFQSLFKEPQVLALGPVKVQEYF